MDITKIANRIANLHYPDIPKTRGDKMFRRQRVIELQKLIESELKNCSIPDVVGRSEQFFCNNKKMGVRCVEQCLGCFQFENKD